MLDSHSAFPPLARAISVLMPSVPSVLLIPSIGDMLERAIFCKVGEVVGNYRGLSLRSNAYWQVERETEAQKGEKQERGGRREGRGRERERDSSAEKTTGGGDRREGKEGFRRDTRGATESLSNVEIVVSKISQSVPKQ